MTAALEQFQIAIEDLADSRSNQIFKAQGNNEICVVLSAMLRNTSNFFGLFDSVIDGIIATSNPVLFFNSLDIAVKSNAEFVILTENANNKDNALHRDLSNNSNWLSERFKVKKIDKDFEDSIRNHFGYMCQFAISDEGSIFYTTSKSTTKIPIINFSFNRPDLVRSFLPFFEDKVINRLENLY